MARTALFLIGLALLTASRPALAEGPKHLVLVDGVHYHFIDQFGVRHHIRSQDILKAYWKREKPVRISLAVLQAYPEGHPIDGTGIPGHTGSESPDWFNRRLDPEVKGCE